MAEPIAEVGYLAGLCRHDGTDWQKLKIGTLFNFESVVAKLKLEDATGVVLTLDLDTVPSGKVWIITDIAARNIDGDIATSLTFFARHDDSDYTLGSWFETTAEGQWRVWQGEIPLDANDNIRIAFNGVAAPETCQGTVYGYQMDAP